MHTYCVEVRINMSKYDKNYYLRQTQRGFLRKKHLVDLRGGGCERCGYNKCSRCLSFHHRDPKLKKFMLDLRNIGNFSWKRVLEEFDKCELLCMNCHGEHHDAECSKDYMSYEMTRRESQINMCLNCGADFTITQTEIDKGGGKFCSNKCRGVCKRKVDRPSKEELLKLLWKEPTTTIATIYGVSDNAVAKWAKSYGLTKPPRGYWTKQKFSNDSRAVGLEAATIL